MLSSFQKQQPPHRRALGAKDGVGTGSWEQSHHRWYRHLPAARVLQTDVSSQDRGSGEGWEPASSENTRHPLPQKVQRHLLLSRRQEQHQMRGRASGEQQHQHSLGVGKSPRAPCIGEKNPGDSLKRWPGWARGDTAAPPRLQSGGLETSPCEIDVQLEKPPRAARQYAEKTPLPATAPTSSLLLLTGEVAGFKKTASCSSLVPPPEQINPKSLCLPSPLISSRGSQKWYPRLFPEQS